MPETYTCQKCGKVAKTKQALERHAAYHEDDRPYSCEVCLQRFKNSDDRGKHYRRLKRDGKFAFACQVCHKHFKGQDLLAKHLEILGCLLKQAKPVSGANDGGGKTAEGMAKSESVKSKQTKVEEELVLENDVKCACKICETEFIGTDNLRRHYRDVHNDNKRQVCIHCGQTLSSKDSLARHYSIFHQNNYPFQCEICDQKFKIKESLCRHVKFVHKDGGYPCEICQRVFSQPVNLKKHMAMHTNSKEFSCCVCGREFRWKQALQKHMQLHTGPVVLKTQVSIEIEHGDAENNVVSSERSGDDNQIDKNAKGGQHVDTNEFTSMDLGGSSPVAPDSLSLTENKGFLCKNRVKNISYKNRDFDKNGKNVAFQKGSTDTDGMSTLFLDHWNEDLFSSKHSFEEIPGCKTRKLDCTDSQRSPKIKTNATMNQEITEATKHHSPEPKVSNDKPDSALNDLATIIVSYAKKDSSRNTDSVVDKGIDYRKIVVESESNKVQKPCVDKVQDACSPELITADMDVDIETNEFEQFIESKSEHGSDVDTHPGTPDVQINDISCVEMDSCEATTSSLHCMSDSETGMKPTSKNTNVTLNWKKTRWYNRSLSGSKTDQLDTRDENFHSTTQNETVDSNFQNSSQDSRSSKNRMQNCDNNITYAQPRKKFKTYNSGIYTSVPTSEEENAPRLVFRPSSIKDILTDKKRDDVDVADRHAARGDTGERKAGSSRSEFKALLQTANVASTFKKTHNPFLIPFSPQTDKEETETMVTSKADLDQEVVSSTKKSKQIPNIPGAYKFSLVKHMLSLKNEDHFDKELFRNPLYNTQVDVKSLTHIIERHKVENTDNMYDLSARQICPFQWVGVRVNKNDSAASSKDKHVGGVEDRCSQNIGVKDNPDNEAVDICGEISVKKQELERKKEAQSNNQFELEISSHTNTVGHATVGENSGESRGELSETACVLNELTSRNGSPGSEAKLAPSRASSGSSMAKIKRYEIMKDLVKCTKYHNSGKTKEISLLRNPFEINPAHISRVFDKTKPVKFVSDINNSSDCYMKGANNICSRATEDGSGQTRVSEIRNKMKMVHEVGTNGESDEGEDGLEESEVKITRGFDPVANFSVENESVNLTTHNMAASYGMCSIGQSFVSTCSREIATIPSTSNVTFRNHGAIQGVEMPPVSSVERKIQGSCFAVGRDSNSVGWTKDASVVSVSSEQNDITGLKARAISWQGSKIQMVPKFQESSSNRLCHVAKVTAAETSLPETIAQELNQVLCSSLQNDTIFVDDLPTDLTTHQTNDGTSIAKHNIPARSVGNSELRNRNLNSRVNSSVYRQAQGDNQTQVRPSFGHSVHETVAGNSGNFCSMENSTRQAPSFPGTVSATATMSSTAIGKGWSRGLFGKTFSAGNKSSVSSSDSGGACLRTGSLERVRDSNNKFQMLPKGQVSVFDLLASQGNRQHRFENLDKMLDSFIT